MNLSDLSVKKGVELGDGTGADKLDINGELRLESGAGKQTGTATLVAGTVTVANTLVTASTKVFKNLKTNGGTTGTVGYTVNAGVGFTLTSSSNTDTSTYDWFLINPTDADVDTDS